MKMKKVLLFLLAALMAVSSLAGISETEGSSNYIYDPYQRAVPVPPAYTHVRSYMASDFEELKSLKSMQAACVKNGRIYVSCTNQIIIFDEEFHLLYNADSYTGLDGHTTSFDSNVGIFAMDTGEYYVCEPNRSRILHFGADNQLLRVLDNPGITGVDASVKYRPTQMVVDDAGRMFVIA